MNTYKARVRLLAYWIGIRTIRLPHTLTIVVTIALVFGLVYQVDRAVISATPREATNQPGVQRARLSDEISIHAAGRGNPWINLSDGHELITPYSGPRELIQILERNEAQPLSLCSADFDEDGVPDLISGYAVPSGGIVTLLRGNVDSIYPNAPEAKQRKAEGAFTDAPFLSPAFVFGARDAADFIGAGDFDGDGHWDVVTAARGSSNLYLMSGDGKGGLRETKTIDLPGGVTAMVVGEINRRDGLDEIVVGVSGEQGAKALVFEGPEGALRASPEAFDLPAETTSLALGQLDDSYEMDLAIAAGRELLILHGRDRKLSLDSARQAQVSPPSISRRTFQTQIRSIAVGDFTGRHAGDVALILTDGSIHSISREKPKGESSEAGESLVDWREDMLTYESQSGAGLLVSSRMSSAPGDSLLIVDSTRREVQVITDDIAARASDTEQAARRRFSTSLDLDGSPAAVLPMRLNCDALADLVVISAGRSAVTVAMSVPQSTFTVTNTSDAGPGSLRQAIVDTNANPGADIIRFSIPGFNPHSITLFSNLPSIADSVTLDGTSQPGFAGSPLIELEQAFADFTAGLVISGGSTTVRGLVIHGFGRAAIYLKGPAGSNVIEGNFLETDVSGNVNLSRLSSSGAEIDGSSNNVIGGTIVAARNTITAGFFSILIENFASSVAIGNRIQGNHIGCNFTGSASLGGSGEILPNGVVIQSVSNNVVGGAITGAGNLISGGNTGVYISADAVGNLVQGNLIGTDATGTAGLGSRDRGVGIGNANSNTIGGTTPSARNVISAYNFNGVTIFEGTDNFVQGNFIGVDVSGSRPLGNRLNGVTVTDAPGNVIGGSTTAALNIISGNTEAGVGIGVFEQGRIGGTGTLVQGNHIGTDVSGTRALGNGQDGIFVENDSRMHTIKENLIAYNNGNGINIPNVTDQPGTPAVRISILSNSVFSNSGMAVELGNDGPTPNDNKDVDQGANDLQNFPVLTSARTLSNPTSPEVVTPASVTTVSGVFNSTPNTAFTLQFFFGSNCSGSGHQFTGSIPIPLQPTIQVTTDATGNAPFSFSFNFPTASSSGFVNSTATSGTGNTSEVSECIAVTNPNQLRISGACKGDGKQLIINGSGFAEGAKVFLNGAQEKTSFVSSTQVIAKKAGKRAQIGDTLKVRNPDATETPQITYTRVNCSDGGTLTEELLTDDGTVEILATNVSLLLVNRLTPSSYPARLLQIRIDFSQLQGQPSPVGQRIRLVAFIDPSGSGRPPNSPVLLVDQNAVIPLDGGFVDFPVVGPTITAGDLYVGFQAPNPANGVFFSADTNGLQRQRAFQSTDNGLTLVGPIGFGSGSDFRFANFLIRAVVSKGG